jgi:hypothetical protein
MIWMDIDELLAISQETLPRLFGCLCIWVNEAETLEVANLGIILGDICIYFSLDNTFSYSSYAAIW